MIDKARANADKAGVKNVEFRHGHIESLPVDDNSVDVVISNCVINLSPNKEEVFREVQRVLKPGGRFFISDLVLLDELPRALRESDAAYCACVGGATLKDEYLAAMANAGLSEIRVTKEAPYPSALFDNQEVIKELLARDGGLTTEELKYAREAVVSVHVEGRKGFGPGVACCGGVC
jgi:SAM-dependent methyltransferase